VLTHKGRSADSGHYVAWVKQKDGSWICYDDDKLVSSWQAAGRQLAGSWQAPGSGPPRLYLLHYLQWLLAQSAVPRLAECALHPCPGCWGARRTQDCPGA